MSIFKGTYIFLRLKPATRRSSLEGGFLAVVKVKGDRVVLLSSADLLTINH